MFAQKMTFYYQSLNSWLMQLLVMKLYPSQMDHQGKIKYGWRQGMKSLLHFVLQRVFTITK